MSKLGVALVAASVVMVATASSVVAIVGRQAPSSVVPQVEPVYQTIATEDSRLNQSATIVVNVSPAPTLTSLGGDGVVTDVSVEVGDRVDMGTELYTVDGVPVFALLTDTALYRPMALGDSGDDVEVLQAFLNAVNPPASFQEPDGVFGKETLASFRTWQRSVGLKQTASVNPSLFGLISEPTTVMSVTVTPGQPAPGLGNTVLVGSSSVQSLQVTVGTSVDVGSYLFISSGDSHQLELSEEGWSAEQPAELVALAGPTTEEQTSVTIEGRLELAVPTTQTAVASSSLVQGPEGYCVLIRQQDGRTEPRAVDVVGSAISGAALVDNAMLVGQDVLVNPYAVLGESASCR